MMWLNYFKISCRTLLKNRVYAIVNVLGLSMGLATCLIIGLHIWNEYGYDRFHRHFDNLYRLTEWQQQSDGRHLVAVTPGPLAPSLARDFPEIAGYTRIGRWPALLERHQAALEPEYALIAENSFFQLFDFPLLAGDPREVLNHPDELVITARTAEHIFGKHWQDSAVVGKALVVNAATTFRIGGVAADPPVNTHLQFDVLLPFKYIEATDEWSNKWNSNNYHTYIQLHPGAEAAFSRKIERQLSHYAGIEDATLHLQPLRDIYLRSEFDFETDWGKRSHIFYVRVFLVVGLMVLMIAVANFVNLATARSLHRAKEVGVRKTAGASQGGLMAQFLMESLLMSAIAIVIALILAQSALPLFERITGQAMQVPFERPGFWAAAISFALLAALLAGTYPAFFLSRFRPAGVLRGIAHQGGTSGPGLRKILVVGQFGLSVTLVVATLVIYQQLRFVQHKELGFDEAQLLYLDLKGETRGKAAAYKAQLSQLAGVEAVAATTSNLVNIANASTLEWEGQADGDEFPITQMNIDADFLAVADIPLVSGRNFSWAEPADTVDTFGRYLVNESAARRMGYTVETALGKEVSFWGFKGEIIGVIRDFHFRPLQNTIEPLILRFRPKEFYYNLLVKTHPGQTASVLSALGGLHQRMDAHHPLSFGFVDEALNEQYKAERRMWQIALCFAVLAIFVSCLGLFGLAAFMAERRTKEVSIRKVLGASVGSVVGMLAKDFLMLVVVAFVLATPLAWYLMESWLADFAYRIQLRWWMFALAGGAALLIAFGTVSIQGVKAALADPVKALRAE